MSTRKNKQSWKSGSVRGYNGDGISITATYLLPEGRPAPDAVDLRFYDNSVRPHGPFSRLRSLPVRVAEWIDLPMPDPEGRFGEAMNEGFTITGQVRIEGNDAGHFVRLRLNWGEGQFHAEEGYILRLGA